uniref:Ig-like domain-containing protein n=1 Tax=Lates calcarifer TaxID=8187 RepID=A0A4W6C056_LATCA
MSHQNLNILFIFLKLVSFSLSSLTASFPGGKQHCTQNNYCVTLTEGEISAETGLCVVLQCSFTTAADFKVESVIWFKCDPPERKCDKSDTPIFNSRTNENVEPDFRGRVSLLEPDLSHNNCSIIINDLKTSDSGLYQLRVGGTYKGKEDGFTFESKANVTVTGLSQKPTVMVPPLTEGQQTTLTCTAPGLCSGSDPKITWMWRGAGEKNSPITGNITTNQGQTSTLTFNPSAEHHGTNLTCKVRFKWAVITKETVTLNVTCEYRTYCTLLTKYSPSSMMMSSSFKFQNFSSEVKLLDRILKTVYLVLKF